MITFRASSAQPCALFNLGYMLFGGIVCHEGHPAESPRKPTSKNSEIGLVKKPNSKMALP